MKIWLPFLYPADFQRRGDRRVERWWLHETEPFEIRDIIGYDAPVVYTLETDNGVLEWRDFDGVLMRQCMDNTSCPATAETLAAEIDTGTLLRHYGYDDWHDHPGSVVETHRPYKDVRRMSVRGRKDLELERLYAVRKWLMDGKADGLRRMQKVASEMIAIDGVLYKPAAEPLLRVRLSVNSTPTIKIETVVPPAIIPLVDEYDAFFRADEHEAATACAEMIASSRVFLKILDSTPTIVDTRRQVSSPTGRPFKEALDQFTVLGFAQHMVTAFDGERADLIDPQALIAYGMSLKLCREERFPPESCATAVQAIEEATRSDESYIECLLQGSMSECATTARAFHPPSTGMDALQGISL